MHVFVWEGGGSYIASYVFVDAEMRERRKREKSQVFDVGMAPTPAYYVCICEPQKLSKLIHLFSRTNRDGLAHTKNEWAKEGTSAINLNLNKREKYISIM